MGGEAGYLVAAEAVLRALVHAEDGRYSRGALSEGALLRALGDAKPLGATATDVLDRMRRERLITRRHAHRDESWFAAAPAGRQFLHRDTSARDAAWTVADPLALLDVLYADGRGGGEAFLPWVQAVGRLADEDLAPDKIVAEFKKLYDEILTPLASVDGVTLKITVDIEAIVPDGFSDGKIRAVSENARELKFDESGFEAT